jgi:CheY-like chemotaxis protein
MNGKTPHDALPFNAVASLSINAAPVRDAQWRWEPRVLVVDDDAVCQLAARRLFKNLGIAADVVADGSDAVRAAGAWPYVAVFMDCGTEAVDGYRTARQIRAHNGLDHSPPVVAVTSLSREVCLPSGMDHHNAKPLRLESLQAECERLGLIPRPGTRPEPAAARGPSPVALLVPPPGLGAGAAARAATFARDARNVLPTIWRAANVADLAVLEREASDLAQRASEAGVARVAGDPAEDPGTPGGVVRVVIADDDPLARMAIEAMIKRGERLELVGSAADVPQIAQLAAATRPDVAVVDFIMPGGGGPAERLVEMIHRAHRSSA